MSDPWVPIPADVSMLPVVRALLRASARVEQVAARQLEGQGLTPARFDVLTALGDTDGMTVKDLCDAALITKGNLLHVVAALERLGLVERRKGTEDQRQTIVALTAAGQACYRETFLAHVAHMRGFLERLAPADQAALVGLLEKLAAAFEES
jgi:DNA-binding MarR family transcriptional regulator